MSLHIVLASGNRGKLAEFSSLLGERFRFSAQSDLGVEEAEETGLSFIENALIKARNASLHTQLPALADDSGLCVNALGGAPGIYSARFAGSGADDSANNAKLIRELKGINDRRAHFHCALVFVRHAEDPRMPDLDEGPEHHRGDQEADLVAVAVHPGRSLTDQVQEQGINPATVEVTITLIPTPTITPEPSATPPGS